MNKTLKSALLSAAVLLVGSSTFASNMGFKLVKPLNTTSAGNDGTNWVSVPYFNSFATQDAQGMWNDLPATVTHIYRYDPVNRIYEDFDNAFGPNFALTKGEAYSVAVSATGNWTIVGSHDNAFAVSLAATSAGHDGTNWVSVPYHTNKTDAAGLWTELPATVSHIYRYDPVNRIYEDFDNAFGPNFAITIGEAYIVTVGTTSTWTPAHY